MPYSDKHGEFYGVRQDNGNVLVCHTSGVAATRLDASVYPVGSQVSARYEHPDGIFLTTEDAAQLGLEVE